MDTFKITINDKAIESAKKMQEIASAASSLINLEQVRASLLKMSESISQTVKNNLVQNTDLINQSLQSSLRNLAHTVAQFQSTYDMEIMRQSISEMAKTLSDMQTEQLKALSQINFRKINFDFHSKEFDNLVDLACEATIQETEDISISKEELKESFIESQKDESSWKKLNIKLHDNADKFKREYFIVYIIIVFIIN